MPDAAALGRILPVSNHLVEIRANPERGRGLFAREAIAARTLIEAAPVIILPSTQCAALDRTVIFDYYFHWDGDPDGDGRGALGLGLLTLCNHSNRPCARVDRNHVRQTLDLIATSPIEPGEEITIDYGCTLWFEPRD